MTDVTFLESFIVSQSVSQILMSPAYSLQISSGK